MADTATAGLLTELPFNINQHVKVRLTDFGRETYVTYRWKEDGAKREVVLRELESRQDSEGYNSFQLYTVMSIFGGSMPDIATMDMRRIPFETNIILVPDPLAVILAERS